MREMPENKKQEHITSEEVKTMPVPVWMAIIAAGNLILDALDND